MFWFGIVVLAAIGAVSVVWPVLRQRGSTLDRTDGALAIFKDQLAEVERDKARGLISETDAEAASVEIKRRMLAADTKRTKQEGADGGTGLLLAMAVLVPLGAAGVYSLTGAPKVPSIPFAEREQAADVDQDLAALTDRLEARLLADPDGGETRGWTLLATTYMNMGRTGDAIRAWEQLLEREDATSAVFSQYAEALIISENGVVTEKARDALQRARELDASNPAATYYMALGMEQDGDTPAARIMLIERIGQETAPQSWMPVFLREVNRMGAEFGLDPVSLPAFPDAPRGPSQEDIEASAAMTPEERMEFIRSMVAGLAERLQDEPEDLDGWLRLARAYSVLGETENAIEALTSAKTLADALPEGDPRRQMVEQGLAELGG